MSPQTPHQFLAAIDLPDIAVIQHIQTLRRQLDLACHTKTSHRKRLPVYGLSSEQISTSLQQTIDTFLEFMTDPNPWQGRQNECVGLETAMMRILHVYRALGYFHNHLKVPLDQLSLTTLVAFSPVKTALRQAQSFEDTHRIQQASEQAAEKTIQRVLDYIRWLRKEREISPGTEVLVLEAWITVAKFLYHTESNFLNTINYGDILVITTLRKEINKAKRRTEQAPLVVDESLKWLDWTDFLAFVRQLERECQPKYKEGSSRSRKATAASIQRFLIAALLAYMPPDRQRTLRELEKGRTLLKGTLRQSGNKLCFEEADQGNWYIHLQATDYKTGKLYGEQWQMIPDILYPYLESWLTQGRMVFDPIHNRVFTQQNGKPFLTPSSFLSVFKRAAFRITGKATTPHLVRHMLVTHLKRNGASDEVMRSLAFGMKHSEKTQQQIYDRRLSIEQGASAQKVVLSLAMGVPLDSQLAKRPITVESLLEDIHQLSLENQHRLVQLLTAKCVN